MVVLMLTCALRRDPAKCAFANNGFDSGRLHIHQCMSESQYIDDEGFLFEPYNNGAAKSVHTIWNRCLYKEASGSIKLSGSGSANCNADRNLLEYTVEIREDFTTKVTLSLIGLSFLSQ